MIGFVNGEIEYIYDDKILVDCGFMGYNIFVPGNVLDRCAIGDEVKLYTYLSVREDAMNLFGFLTRDELDIFKLLITVNGIGPKGALAILTIMTPNDLRFAVAAEDAKLISKAPGVGAKTAQKVILELKDKLSIEDVLSDNGHITVQTKSESAGTARNITDAVEVLVALGYSQTDSLKAVKACEISTDMDTEDIVKLALKCI